MPWLTSEDVSRWNEGTHFDCYGKLGAHPNRAGSWFAVWAPHADRISVIGDFNGWDPAADRLTRTEGGLWEGYVRGAKPGQHYKYRVGRGDFLVDKTDPFARALEAPAKDGSALVGMSSIIVDGTGFEWGDGDWMSTRKGPESLSEPVSIYEVHLGSWKRREDGHSYSYRDIAEPLADHVEAMGFTHVELMPVLEHPYYPSWGYQVVGYYAPTHRYGAPADFKYLVDYLHRRGIGVILDWVPAHFATDPQGLSYFDGSPLYEYTDPVMRHHPDWGTLVFDYNKRGVRNFLIGNACYWLDEFHLDGLRFDAVASMLYRDYSRDHWTPNMFGGRENLEAIDFLKKVNEAVYGRFPGVMMIAEESTAWPKVSAPTYDGGLGFLYKWNMGWMHDVLKFMEQDPLNRKYHFNSLTFSMVYAYSEHYALPLSHDEVVHMKGSLWSKMPGDDWQKAANLRLLYGHMWGHPGKKLLFMGGEFGQYREWSHDRELDWGQLELPLHAGIQRWVKALNALYAAEPALCNDAPGGFEWIDISDWQNCVVSYRRIAAAPPEASVEATAKGKRRKKAPTPEPGLAFVFNFTPVPREDYGVHLPEGEWELVLNSDAEEFGGSGMSPGDVVQSKVHGAAGKAKAAEAPRPDPYALLTLPPLGVLVFKQKVK